MTAVGASAPLSHVFRDVQDPETAEISLIIAQMHIAIKSAIKEKGWSQIKACTELNLRGPVIKDLMNDRIPIKDVELLIRLCLRLGLMVYFGTDKPIWKSEKSRVSLVSRKE